MRCYIIVIFSLETRQRFSYRVSYNSAMQNVELKFWQPHTPSHQLSSRFSRGKDPPERFICSENGEAGSFQIWAQKRGGPYNGKAFQVRCGQLLFFAFA